MPMTDLMASVNDAVLADLGEPVTIAPDDIILGIFDVPTEEGKLKSLKLDYPYPVVRVKDQQAQRLNIHDALTLRGTQYTIANKIPDGAGLTALVLADSQVSHPGDWL